MSAMLSVAGTNPDQRALIRADCENPIVDRITNYANKYDR